MLLSLPLLLCRLHLPLLCLHLHLLLLCLYLHLLPLLLCLHLPLILLLLCLYLTRRGYLLLPHSTERLLTQIFLMQLLFLLFPQYHLPPFQPRSATSNRLPMPAVAIHMCSILISLTMQLLKFVSIFFSYHFPPAETNLLLLTTRKSWASSRLR